MSASPLTAIKHIIESDSISQADVICGLSYAKWGDCLSSEWDLLYHSPNIETTKKICQAILEKYENLAKILENPKTGEDWYSKTWGDFLKTRKKSAFFKVYNNKPAGDMYNNPFWQFDYEKRIGIEKSDKNESGFDYVMNSINLDDWNDPE